MISNKQREALKGLRKRSNRNEYIKDRIEGKYSFKLMLLFNLAIVIRVFMSFMRRYWLGTQNYSKKYYASEE